MQGSSAPIAHARPFTSVDNIKAMYVQTCLRVQTHVLEWDEAKNEQNRVKHGVDFADASRVFAGECWSLRDHRFNYGEDRYITLGELNGRVMVIAHTPRGDRTRIISMRKANRREQEAYENRPEAT